MRNFRILIIAGTLIGLSFNFVPNAVDSEQLALNVFMDSLVVAKYGSKKIEFDQKTNGKYSYWGFYDCQVSDSLIQKELALGEIEGQPESISLKVSNKKMFKRPKKNSKGIGLQVYCKRVISNNTYVLITVTKLDYFVDSYLFEIKNGEVSSICYSNAVI